MRALNFAISGLALLISFNTFAANVPANFDPAKWEQLSAKVLASSNVMQIEAGELRFLSQIVPEDTSVDHHSRYLSILGNYDAQSKFNAEDISSVDEGWQIDQDGIWSVDQWIYHMTLKGDLIDVTHTQIRERDGQVLSIDDLKAGNPTDAEELQRWGALLDQWTSEL